MTLARETFLEYSIVVIFLLTNATNLHLELRSVKTKKDWQRRSRSSKIQNVYQDETYFSSLESGGASMIAPISPFCLFVLDSKNISALRDSRREERRSLEGWQHGKTFWIVSLMWVLLLLTPSKPNLCFQDQKEVPKIGISGKSKMTMMR